MATKVDAIQRMRKPKMKFVDFTLLLKNLSSTFYLINNLLKISFPFKWTKQCHDAFQAVKDEMQSNKFCSLRFKSTTYTCKRRFYVSVCTVLSHIYPDNVESPICITDVITSSTEILTSWPGSVCNNIWGTKMLSVCLR